MSKSWLIGSAPGCEVVAGHPTVSGRHCRLTFDGEGFLLEDLGSTNGTYVNGKRTTGPVRVTQFDRITVGQEIPVPWPSDAPGIQAGTRVLRIGREADNDVVVSLPTVSGYHARVLWEGKPGVLIVEDLGSSNGTAVGSPERKVTRAVVLSTETIYLGTHPIAAAPLLERLESPVTVRMTLRGDQAVLGRNADCDVVVDHASVSGRHARLVRSGDQILVEDLGSTNGTFVGGQRIDRTQAIRPGDAIVLGSQILVLDAPPRTATQVLSAPTVLETAAPTAGAASPVEATTGPSASPAGLGAEFGRILAQPVLLTGLIVQAPLIAMGIVLASRNLGAGSSTAIVLFALSLASLWFGLSSACLASAAQPTPANDPTAAQAAQTLADRFVVRSALGLIQAGLAWLVVANGARLQGSAPAMLAWLSLGALVGVALGLAIATLTPRAAVAWVALGVLVPLWLFGGAAWPLARMASWSRVVASVAPTRWLFEGLLLIEVDEGAPAVVGTNAQRPAAPRVADRAALLDEYFPAETERMGLRADAIALTGMLAGLMALAAFMVANPNRAA